MFDYEHDAGSVAPKVAMLKSLHIDQNQVLLLMLRRRRHRLRLTQSQLAELLGREQSIVSKIERGERRLDVIELKTWLRALGVDFLEFMREFHNEISVLPTVDPRLGRGRRRAAGRPNRPAE